MGAGAIDELPDWERLLAAEIHLQRLVPEAVLAGDTTAALHAGHRVSYDGGHVLEHLRDNYDHVLEKLEAVAGWKTEGLMLAARNAIYGTRLPRHGRALRTAR